MPLNRWWNWLSRGAGLSRRVRSQRSRRFSRRPGLVERLEQRLLPAAITVTTLNDEVNGAVNGISLREAIATANGNADADVISFAGGLSGGTLNLSGGELLISGTTTITGFVNGAGLPLLTIDANDLSRIFRINNSVSGASTAVELSGLTLTDGNVASGEDGGAILHESGELEIRNCSITGNTADDGGGIFTRDPLTIEDSLITDNVGRLSAGGIYSRDELTINDSTISGNRSENGTGGFDGGGGGIKFRYGNFLIVNRSTISGNVSASGPAGSRGGGIFFVANEFASPGEPSSVLRVTDSTISGNTTARDGGGIYFGGGEGDAVCEIIDSTISGNTAGHEGGGVYFYGGDDGDATLDIVRSTISGNTSGRSGGGLYAYDGTTTILSSTISGNISGDDGGGIYAYAGDNSNGGAALTIQNSTISGNRTTGNDSTGAGIHSNVGRLTIESSTVSANFFQQDSSGGHAQLDILFDAIAIEDLAVGQATIRNSIFANSPDNADIRYIGGLGEPPDEELLIEFSLVEFVDFNPASPFVNSTNNNLFGNDPNLGPLQDNGGPTFTHALLTGSPALDAGSAALLPADAFDLDGDTNLTEALPFDQRGTGFARVVGSGLDIGAFETQAVVATVGRLAIGSDVGRNSQPVVRVYDETAFTGGGTPTPLFEISATDTYGATYRGGVRVAVADVNGDGIADIITAPGRNKAPDIKIFSGVDGTLLGTIAATATYGANFKGGVYVAAGDVTGDGRADIVVSQELGSPTVIVFRNLAPDTGVGFAEYNRTRVFADFRKFIGGATVAVGDVAGSTNGEIIVGSGPGMRTVVRVLSVTATSATAGTLTTLRDINPPAQFGNRFNHGVYVSVGDVVGSDGKLEILTGSGSGSLITGAGSTVRIYNGATGALLNSFQAFGTRAAVSNSPVRLAVRNGTIFAVQSQDGRSQYQVRRFSLNEQEGGGFFSVAATDPSDPRFFGGGLFIG